MRITSSPRARGRAPALLTLVALCAIPAVTARAQRPLSALATRNQREPAPEPPTPKPCAPTRKAQPLIAVVVPDVHVGLAARPYRRIVPGVDLTWQPVPGATSYTVSRGLTASGPFDAQSGLTIGDLNGGKETYQAGVPVDRQLFYRVDALKDGKPIARSEPVAVLVKKSPTGLTHLTASSPTHGVVVLTWAFDAEASGYAVDRSKAGGQTETLVPESSPLPGNASRFVDHDLWDGATYTYFVHSLYADRTADRVTSVTVTVGP